MREVFAVTTLLVTRITESVRKFLKICVQCPIFQTNLGEDEPEKKQFVQSGLFAATRNFEDNTPIDHRSFE